MNDLTIITTTVNAYDSACPICGDEIRTAPYRFTKECKYPVHIECGEWYVADAVKNRQEARCPIKFCNEDFSSQFWTANAQMYSLFNYLNDVAVMYLGPFYVTNRWNKLWKRQFDEEYTFKERLMNIATIAADAQHTFAILLGFYAMHNNLVVDSIAGIIIASLLARRLNVSLVDQRLRSKTEIEIISSDQDHVYKPLKQTLALEDRCQNPSC